MHAAHTTATRRDVEKIARKLGAQLAVHYPSPDLDCELIAPNGYHWACCGAHVLVGSQENCEPVGHVYGDLLERAKQGIEPCDRNNPQCCDWHGWSYENAQ